ncbi:MAG: hypothetical protein DHS80DRAFT_29520 [Piptocephalis tieghemiana]|nr:MAG: hypothetical protein DHS80DRAFT_29520 [Piptocephalis tieghemiana]
MTSLQKYISTKYYQWELTTAIYMLEPQEKLFFNLFFLLLLLLTTYATFAYLPTHVINVFERTATYFYVHALIYLAHLPRGGVKDGDG